VAHGAVEAPYLDVKANEVYLVRNIAYTDVTNYIKVTPNNYNFQIFPHGSRTPIHNVTVNIEQDSIYTVLASGTLHSSPVSFGVSVLKDSLDPPKDSSSARLRLYNGISDSKWIDLRLKEADGTTIISELKYKYASDYVDIQAGRWTIEVFSDASKTVSLYTETNYFGNGGLYSLFAEGLVKDITNNNVRVVTKKDLTYTYAQLRVSHASPDAPNVDIYTYDSVSKVKSLIFSTVRYNGFTQYKSLSVIGQTTLLVTEAGTDNLIHSEKMSLMENTYNTLYIYGLVASGTTTPLSFKIFKDNLTNPEGYQQAKIRFVHTISNAPGCRLFLNGHEVIHSLQYGEASDYLVTTSGYAKLLVLSLADGSTILAQDVQLGGGSIYTAVLEGLIGGAAHQEPQLVLASDAHYDYFQLRVTHASFDLKDKSLSIMMKSGKEVITIDNNLHYGVFTNYHIMVLKDWKLSVLLDGKEVLSNNLQVSKEEVVTVAIVGLLKTTDINLDLELLISKDNNSPPDNSQANRVRFAHLTPTHIHFDVYIDDQLVKPDIEYKTLTDYIILLIGDHKLEIREHDGKASLLKDSFNIEGGSVYTIFIEGVLHNDTPQLSAVVSKDIQYQFYFFRFSHTSSNTDKVDVITEVGEKVLFEGISYGETTTYMDLILLNNNLLITESGKKDHVLLRITPEINEDTAYTLALIGVSSPVAPLDYLWLTDTLDAPASSKNAKVRMVHTSPMTLSVDIFFNNQLVFKSLSYKDASTYAYLEAGVYRIDAFASSKYKTPLLSTSFNLTGGTIVTLFIEGFNNSFTIKSFTDASYSYFNLRVAHALPNVGKIGVLVGNTMIFSSLEFSGITSF